MAEWDLKGRPRRSRGKQQSGGLLLRPWENPSYSGRSPEDCERNTSSITKSRPPSLSFPQNGTYSKTQPLRIIP